MKIIVCRKYAESLCPTQSRLDQVSTYTAQENLRQEILKFHTIIHCTHTLEETSDKKFWQFKQAHIMHSHAGEKFWQVLCRCSRKLKIGNHSLEILYKFRQASCLRSGKFLTESIHISFKERGNTKSSTGKKFDQVLCLSLKGSLNGVHEKSK